MKKTLTVIGCLFAMHFANAQSKVFKEVSDEISSQVKIISQDDALVGYLVFTQLEKASEDSFNYKITIMDENLNDIGKINFKEENLLLQGVSFEQDMLCLSYLKSNIIGHEYKSVREFKKALPSAKHYVFNQFLNLEGKVIKTQLFDVAIKLKDENYTYTGGYGRSKGQVFGSLKHGIQLKNISQKGFACMYGDEDNNHLVTFNAKGDILWKKTVDNANAFGLLTSNKNIFLLSKSNKGEMLEGGYSLQGFGVGDSSAHTKFDLKDKNGNALKVLSFQSDPLTGKPYLAGNIIDADRGNGIYSTAQLTRGTYSGVFTINLDGPDKADLKPTYSYWGDGSLDPAVSRRGRFSDIKAYANYYKTIKDFQGNTYFVGSSILKRPRIGNTVISTALIPFGGIGLFTLVGKGTSKYKLSDAILLKQNEKGAISVENTVACNKSSFFNGRYPLSEKDNRSFYNVVNSNTKTNYLIIDDVKDIVIYNVNQKKIARSVPHKDGKILTYVYPAKEGHIMVAEYNKKEKYSKFSIEALN
jgi:hypothetical protein